MNWRERAACYGMVTKKEDPDVFYPEGGRGVSGKRVCKDCPVKDACREYILSVEVPGDRHGIWGDMTAEERRVRYDRKVA